MNVPDDRTHAQTQAASRKPHRVIGLGLLLVVALLLLLRSPSEEATGPPAAVREVVASTLDAADAPDGTRASASGRQRVPEPAPWVHVIDARSEPVADAEVWVGVVRGDHGVLLPEAPAGRTDDHGLLELPMDSDGSLGCIRKAGYLSVSFAVPDAGTAVVVLHRSRRIEISSMGPVGPVPDCLVCVTLQDAMPTSGTRRLMANSEGVLESTSAVWRGRTGVDGRCALDVPPERDLFVSVFHDDYYPVERWALALDPIPAGDSDLRREVTLRDMLGIAVAVPGGVTIATHLWKYDHRSRATEVGALARYAYCKQKLEERMPRAVALTFAIDSPEGDTEVRFVALDAVGREWALEDRFQPLRFLREPSLPREVPTSGTAVVDVAMAIGGRRVHGAPMLLGRMSRTGEPLLLTARSGVSMTVPAGDYWVEPTSPLDFGPEVPSPAPTPVPDGSRTTLTYSVPHELIRVDIVPTVEGDTHDRTVVVGLASGDTSVGTMWRSERGPLVFWLPPGDYALRASAPGYSVTSTSLRVRSGDVPITIDDLVLRR